MAQNSSVEEAATAIEQSTETDTLDTSLIMVAPTEKVSPSDPSLAIPVDDPEALKARIRQLREQNQAPVEERDALAGERDALAVEIAEITAPGGSLVTAYCASREISRNTAVAEEDCSTIGYVCAPVSGFLPHQLPRYGLLCHWLRLRCRGRQVLSQQPEMNQCRHC